MHNPHKPLGVQESLLTLDETKNVINFTLCDAPLQPGAGPNSPHTPRPQEICLKMLQDKETKAINKRTKKILEFWTLLNATS